MGCLAFHNMWLDTQTRTHTGNHYWRHLWHRNFHEIPSSISLQFIAMQFCSFFFLQIWFDEGKIIWKQPPKWRFGLWCLWSIYLCFFYNVIPSVLWLCITIDVTHTTHTWVDMHFRGRVIKSRQDREMDSMMMTLVGGLSLDFAKCLWTRILCFVRLQFIVDSTRPWMADDPFLAAHKQKHNMFNDL